MERREKEVRMYIRTRIEGKQKRAHSYREGERDAEGAGGWGKTDPP